mgnify:CR=1 FL=1
MERIVRMSEVEYDRFCEFQGAEKTVRSMRAQMDMQRAEYDRLAEVVEEAFDIRIDGSQIIVLDQEKAMQALRLAAEIQR